MVWKVSVVLSVLLLFFASGAVADSTTFDLTATGTNTTMTLTLTGTPSAASPGVYDITGATGTIDGQSVTLLTTTGPGVISDSSVADGWYIEYDNLLSLNGPYVDYYGLGFELANGTLANLYYNAGYLYAELGNNPPSQEVVTVQLVPEPGTLALLCVGLLVLTGLVTRKQPT